MMKVTIEWALVLSIVVSTVFHADAFFSEEGKAGLRGRTQGSPLDQLASEIEGSIVYSRYHHIYKMAIGDWKPIGLCQGEYARWSPDGKKIAVYDKRSIFVVDAESGDRKLVTDEGWGKHGCPIEFHANCREIIFIRRNKRGLWAVDIHSGEMRKLADFHDYTGEPGISADGKRIACRVGSDLYAIDLIEGSDFLYARRACSSGVSPDGKWLMNNGNDMDPAHNSMSIRSWDGKDVKILRVSICQSEDEWDNQHWSNHNDYICLQGGKTGDSYVVKVSAKRGTRVTRVGHTLYPDLYVRDTGLKTQGSRHKTQERKRELADLRLESWLLNLIPAVAAPGSTGGEKLPGSSIVLVNKEYNRLTSRVLIRCIPKPTRANLDHAAYDSNVMRHDPAMFEPDSPPAQALSDLHFGKTLVPESLTDRLSRTPLTPAEKAAPMAWLPMTEYLMDWNFDSGYALAEAGWRISEDTWNDHRIPRAYQEISRVYLHKNEDGKHSIWVRVEFKPWVEFLKNVDDEDNDGFPEIYGMMNGQLLNEKVVQRLLSDYTQRILSRDEVAEWGHDIGANWYDKYNTTTLESEQTRAWPNAQTELEVKAELDGLILKQPDVVIRGKPFGKNLYNVFLTRNCRSY